MNAHVRYLNDRETTVSIRHLAPAGSEPSSVQPPEHIRNDDPVRIPQHNIHPVTLSSNNDSEHQKSNYTPGNTPIIDNAPAILESTRTLNAPIDDNAPVIAEPRRSTGLISPFPTTEPRILSERAEKIHLPLLNARFFLSAASRNSFKFLSCAFCVLPQIVTLSRYAYVPF